MRKQRMVIGTNVLVQIVAVLALVVMVNWLASRHYARFDWTQSGYYKVSEKTKQALGALKEPVKVVVFVQPAGERDPEIVEKIYQDVRNQLKEFQSFGKDKMQVEYVDPQRDIARARQLEAEYKTDLRENIVIFACGPRHKYVGLEDMVDFDQDMYGRARRVKAFKGEGAFLSAIQTVTEEESPIVYFITGHGERDPESFDPRTGYSTLATYIKRDNIAVSKWNLLEHQSLPTNANVIVIAGPRKPYTDAEIRVLDQYLKAHGRLLVMLDPQQQTGLEALLQDWGVQVDDNLVVSPILGMINVTALGTDYASHPITAKLEGINTSFPYARSVRRAAPAKTADADQPRVTELVKTPKSFWGETEPDADRTEFDPAKDIPGPVTLAVAVEAGRVDIGVTRMVVIGTSSFVDNSSLSGGCLDFFVNALNWLLQREQLIAVSPKVPDEFRLEILGEYKVPILYRLSLWIPALERFGTISKMAALYALVILGLPLAVAVVGLVVWLRRR